VEPAELISYTDDEGAARKDERDHPATSDNAELSLIVTQQKQLLSEASAIRDDIRVLMAIVQRVDGALSRMDRRLRELEGSVP
jgi:hypothetical protein